ncbi:tetratricopeptide repeat protein [Thermosulfidibacter takaii]|uniref:tetratricopeptide repeat protein n=1 Tax=Thermosulfidibacter takaii TaxID=412593 RepID=UPI000838162E|nr:tetratricopeptide repeat protein [Thermosulfidibacter takaii]
MSLASKFLSAVGRGEGNGGKGNKWKLIGVLAFFLVLGVGIGLGFYYYFVGGFSGFKELSLVSQAVHRHVKRQVAVSSNKTVKEKAALEQQKHKVEAEKSSMAAQRKASTGIPTKVSSKKINTVRRDVNRRTRVVKHKVTKKSKVPRRSLVKYINENKISREIQLMEEATKAFREGRYGEAIQKYKLVLNLSPNSRKALLNLGVIYFQLGRYDMAEACFKRVLDKFPLDVDALNNLAVVYIREKKYSQALNLVEKCLAVDPVNKIALINKGICYWKMGNIAEALKVFFQGMKVYPREYRFYLYAGVLLYEQGDTRQSYELLKRAYDLMEDKHSEEAMFLRRVLER